MEFNLKTAHEVLVFTVLRKKVEKSACSYLSSENNLPGGYADVCNTILVEDGLCVAWQYLDLVLFV